MKHILLLIIFSLSIAFYSCKNNSKSDRAKMKFAGYEKKIGRSITESQINSNELTTINIPGNKQNCAINFDEIIDSVYYVKLETRDNNLIGNIDKILIFKERIIIIERLRRQLALIFSKEGKFIAGLSKRGKGPGEYISLRDIAIDIQRDEIVLFDGQGQKMLYFDLNGKYLRETKTYFFCTDFAILQNGNYLFRQIPDINIHIPEISNYNLIITNSKQEIFGKALPDALTDKLPAFNQYSNLNSFNNFEGKVLFSKDLSDTVFEISNEGIKAKYFINMGDKYVKGHLGKDSQIEDLINAVNNKHYYDFDGKAIETDNCLYFTLANFGDCFYLNKTKSLVYGNSYKYSTGNIIDISMPICSTGSFFVSAIWPYKFLPSLQNRKFDKAITQMLKDIKRTDNPILCFYSVK